MRFVLPLFAAPALLSSLACAGVFINPEEGDYTPDVTDVEMSAACSDAWEIAAEAVDVGTLEVAINDDGDEMTINELIECDLKGAAFEGGLEQDYTGKGMDSVFTYSTDVEGKFTTSTSFQADWEITYVCEGGDCGDYEDPCTITFTTDAELDE